MKAEPLSSYVVSLLGMGCRSQTAAKSEQLYIFVQVDSHEDKEAELNEFDSIFQRRSSRSRSRRAVTSAIFPGFSSPPPV